LSIIYCFFFSPRSYKQKVNSSVDLASLPLWSSRKLWVYDLVPLGTKKHELFVEGLDEEEVTRDSG